MARYPGEEARDSPLSYAGRLEGLPGPATYIPKQRGVPRAKGQLAIHGSPRRQGERDDGA